MGKIKKVLTIGRPDRKNPNANKPDIPVTGEGNRTVSRKQATITETDKKGIFLLSDAGSSNGTYYRDGDVWKEANNSIVTTLTTVRFGTFEETIGALMHVYNRQNPPV